ncbi:MAG: NrsF family protein [Polyangiaceae bacterium]|nr:NrsF family protein [Polyangiaceae bacterium]
MAATSDPPSDPFASLRERIEQPSPKVFHALQQELHGQFQTVHGTTRKKRFALTALSILVALLLTSLGSFLRAPKSLLLAGCALSLGASALLIAGLPQPVLPNDSRKKVSPKIHLDITSLPRKRMLLMLTLMGTLVTLALTAHHFASMGEFLETGAGLPCIAHALVAGALALCGLTIVWRNSDPFSPRLTGALLGAFAGVVGVLSVGFSCPHTEGFHLVISHGIGVFILAYLGSRFSARALSP